MTFMLLSLFFTVKSINEFHSSSVNIKAVFNVDHLAQFKSCISNQVSIFSFYTVWGFLRYHVLKLSMRYFSSPP